MKSIAVRMFAALAIFVIASPVIYRIAEIRFVLIGSDDGKSIQNVLSSSEVDSKLIWVGATQVGLKLI